jgi:hypothetical protein
MKANELRKSLLASGMDPAEAEVIVKGRIEAGGVEAEEQTVEKSAAFEELELMEKAISEVVESWDTEEVVASTEAEEASEEIAKGTYEQVEVGEEGDTDVTEIIEEFAKAADSIADAVTSRYDGLAKAVTMSSSAVTALAKATWQLQDDMSALAEGMVNIQKSLAVPVPPRSVTGTVEAIPAPGEAEAVQKSNVVNLKDQVIQKAMKEIQESETGLERRQVLAKAMADMDAGASIEEVAKIVGVNEAS